VTDRRAKHLAKIESNPKSVRPQELVVALRAFGYELDRQRGSHQIFAKEGAYPLNVPIHRPHLKEIYIREVIRRLRAELEED